MNNFIKKKYQFHQKSLLFRVAVRNAGWSSTSFLVTPILQIAATPFLLSGLGANVYGLWMLINSVVAISGVASFGLGAATVKFVSKHNALQDKIGVIRVIRSTMTVYLLLGLVAACTIFLSAPILVQNVFEVQEEEKKLLVTALRISGLALFLRFAYGVVEAVAQGYQRYDLEARFAIFNTVGSIASACVLVLLGKGLVEILLGGIAVLLIGLLFLSISVSKMMGTSSWLKPGIDLHSFREVAGFACWSWLQTLGSLFASQTDKLIVGSLLGPVQLTYYTLCLQLVQVAHGLVTKALAFVFPMASTLSETNDQQKLRTVFAHGMCISVAIGCGLSIPLFLFPNQILTLWVGMETATQAAPLLPILALANALMATSTIPYYYLNGTGYVRLNAISVFASGICVSLGALFLIPGFAALGAAASRLCNLPVSVVNRYILTRKVLSNKSFFSGFIGFDVVFMVFGTAFLIKTTLNNDKMEFGYNATSLIATSFVCSVIAAITSYMAAKFSLRKYFTE